MGGVETPWVVGTWQLKAQVGKQASRRRLASLRQALARGVSVRFRSCSYPGRKREGDVVEPAADLVPGFPSRWSVGRGLSVQGGPKVEAGN